MPRLLLIHPWIHDFAAYNFWVRPLGLLRVAERLAAGGADLRLIDCLDLPGSGAYHTGKFPKTILPAPLGLEKIPRRYGRYGIPLADFEKRLAASLPVDAILVTCLMTYWYPGAFETIRLAKAAAPQTPVILGGTYARLFPEHARKFSGADFVYTGRADQALETCLAEAGVRLQPSGAPVPYYRLGFYPRLPYAALMTAEGCPFRCSYCASGLLQPERRCRPWTEVVQEVAELAAQGCTDLAFYDDALLYQAEAHLHPLLKELIRLPGIRLHTPNGLHARYLDMETARLMKVSGFKTVRLSLETVDHGRQLATGGKIRNPEFKEAVRCLKAAGFVKPEIGAYLMYGLPGQPWEEVQGGVQFLKKLGVRIHLTEFSPLPGTPAWEELIRSGCLTPDIDPLLTNNTVFSMLASGYPSGDIQALKEEVSRYNQS